MTDPQSIESYLDCLSRVLGISKGAKDRLLEEVEDHLREAAEEAVSSGVPRAMAERQAVSRFGSVGTIADRAALAEAVARSRHRIRRAYIMNTVGAALAILFAVTTLTVDQSSVQVVFATFLIGFCSITMVYLRRLTRWGLSPQTSLEATLDRQARAWLKGVRSVRHQLLVLVLFLLGWFPWVFFANHEMYEAQPWRAIVGFGTAAFLLLVIWLRNRVMRARAEKEVASLTA